MINIRCPRCEDMVFLVLPEWEDWIGDLDLGKTRRIGLVCNNCQSHFLLEVEMMALADPPVKVTQPRT